MNKRSIHHKLVALSRVKTWYLLVALVILAVGTAYFLRQNNLGMVELRNVVKMADEQNGDVKKALGDLQAYVSAHMNTSLGEGVFLQESYQRAYNQAIQSAVNYTNPNTQIYAQVEAECRPQYQRGGFYAYVQCAHAKLETLTPGSDPLSTLAAPAVELYTYNFASPLWSPDLAGFCLLLTAVVIVLLLIRLLGYLSLRALLKIKNH